MKLLFTTRCHGHLNVVVWKRTEHFASVRQILYKNRHTKSEQMRNNLSFTVKFTRIASQKQIHKSRKKTQACSLSHGGTHEIFIFRWQPRWQFENPATPAKGTTCFRSFSIGNDLFTTLFTAQMGRGKIHWEAFSIRWEHSGNRHRLNRIPGVICT